jgi:hypothetical protein
MREEVKQGFAIILPVQIALLISNASIAPLGIHKQSTINKKGEIVLKLRMTHH